MERRPFSGSVATLAAIPLLGGLSWAARAHDGPDDGPEPSGERWCNNGTALDFVPEDEDLPELRTA